VMCSAGSIHPSIAYQREKKKSRTVRERDMEEQMVVQVCKKGATQGKTKCSTVQRSGDLPPRAIQKACLVYLHPHQTPLKSKSCSTFHRIASHHLCPSSWHVAGVVSSKAAGERRTSEGERWTCSAGGMGMGCGRPTGRLRDTTTGVILLLYSSDACVHLFF
jgi:hypothetical protein